MQDNNHSDNKDSFYISPVIFPATFKHDHFETTVSYERSDGKAVDLALIHADRAGEALLVLASYRIRRNPNLIPSEHVELSMKEARMLRDLLNRPEVARVLEEEK